MTANVFRHTHRVTYAECTLGNHVYYSRYLDLLEAARGEFFRGLGSPLTHWQALGTTFPVIECRLRYKSPARYDDELTVELWLTAAEKARLNFAYRVNNQAGIRTLDGETLHVCANLEAKPKRLPDDLRQGLLPFCRGNRNRV